VVIATWQDMPVVADSMLLVEQLAANAWPAAIVQIIDGWPLREPAGSRQKRLRCAA
jgi:hypothetical protein